ncbi:hypothetical protein CORC01_01936 [Colletotrichum orchidophilum]|uniref:Uncharacterized protein n=1 Tax=Colletotrichum orchidophilum TaxID=1209926 RepID=A0A1G4BNC4_9PEZI|nr:uncharacterized protein CORC01_01936 [Colletotrichum orchidophilum]OHF02835.1 hypothetical protein CORC01_01936 [Colletotrichum orchidophilum]
MEHHDDRQEQHTRAHRDGRGRRGMKNPHGVQPVCRLCIRKPRPDIALRLRSAVLVPRFPFLANPGQGSAADQENTTTSRGPCVTALDAGHGSSDKTDLTALGAKA